MNLTPKQKTIVDFIQNYQLIRGYSPTLEEIAERMGVSKITIHEHLRALEKRGAIRREKYLARSIEVLREPPSAQSYSFPLLGYIAAGKPIEAIEDSESVDISEMLSTRKSCYVLKVTGNSMIDEQIRDGDYVIVESRQTAENGEMVVALLPNGEATLKKFYKEKKKIRLQPANADMKPILVDEVTIRGVVIGVLRKY